MMNNAHDFAAALNEAFKRAGINDKHSFEVLEGRKYDKILNTSYGQPAVFCFVDKEGAVFKAATFNAPAKGARAKLQNFQNPEAFCDGIASTGYATTAWLYIR